MNLGAHHCSGADARGDFVGGDDALQELAPAGSRFLGHCQRGWNDVNGGMASAQPVALVHLQRHAGGAVDQRSQGRPGQVGVADNSGRSAAAHPDRHLCQLPVLRQTAARCDGPDGVQRYSPGGSQRIGAEFAKPEAPYEASQLFQVFGMISHGASSKHRTVSPRASRSVPVCLAVCESA